MNRNPTQLSRKSFQIELVWLDLSAWQCLAEQLSAKTGRPAYYLTYQKLGTFEVDVQFQSPQGGNQAQTRFERCVRQAGKQIERFRQNIGGYLFIFIRQFLETKKQPRLKDLCNETELTLTILCMNIY